MIIEVIFPNMTVKLHSLIRHCATTVSLRNAANIVCLLEHLDRKQIISIVTKNNFNISRDIMKFLQIRPSCCQNRRNIAFVVCLAMTVSSVINDMP